jgi:UDP-N-acetylglucosamine transferase subunit ALG13
LNKKLIFVTTGTQFPFDRLITQINSWAATELDINVIAQTANSTEKFEHIATVDFLSPDKYDEYSTNATVIIGHAGMGTIITGFEKNKPLILMARKFQYGEHRNDHQQSTANKFNGVKGVYIANNDNELRDLLSRINELESASDESSENRNNLINYLSNVIERA